MNDRRCHPFYLHTDDGSVLIGGIELADAIDVGAHVETGSGRKVVRVTQGATTVREGEELRRALDALRH
jgi:hypothetical protein